MMLKLYALFIFSAPLCVNTFYLPADDLSLEKAEEVQNALCSITTKEIEATANATITRQLKGVCTSSELNFKIEKLQTRILQEIDGIRYILEMNGFKVPDVSLQNENPVSDYKDFNESTYNTRSVQPEVSPQILKSGSNGNNMNVSPRIEEILMYNVTSIDSHYFYYWQISNIHELLTKNDMYKSSPNFVVLGHNLHLQFYPNHLDQNHFAILLNPDSPSFLKEHIFVILNQMDPTSDLVSGVLYGMTTEERLLRFPEKSLKVEGFIVQDTLIVKLEIFLDS